MGAAVSLELASAFSCLVLAEYTPDMAPDKFTYFYWQAMRYPSLDDAVAHMWAFARGRRTVENIRRRLRHSMRRFADGQWGYKVSACPCPLLPSNHPHCPPPRPHGLSRVIITPLPHARPCQMDPEFYFAYDERVKWRELAAVRCPVLVVRGVDSHLWDDASVDKMLRVLPHAARATVPNAGHWVVRSPTVSLTVSLTVSHCVSLTVSHRPPAPRRDETTQLHGGFAGRGQQARVPRCSAELLR
jgi:pimeloyl-ACP methyl ester carboxylesterase